MTQMSHHLPRAVTSVAYHDQLDDYKVSITAGRCIEVSFESCTRSPSNPCQLSDRVRRHASIFPLYHIRIAAPTNANPFLKVWRLRMSSSSTDGIPSHDSTLMRRLPPDYVRHRHSPPMLRFFSKPSNASTTSRLRPPSTSTTNTPPLPQHHRMRRLPPGYVRFDRF